mmetsp:Transcript_12689/g.50712  ORF Transcript_12689/g.50712 Transcript_12689/m.50712 type:complete len:455 (-) Transcript_12689:614-1978(-)
MAETKHVALVDVERDQLLEDLVQGLVGVRDEQKTLAGIVVVEEAGNLHRDVRLARAWRAHDQSESLCDARANGLHLSGRESHSVLEQSLAVVRSRRWHSVLLCNDGRRSHLSTAHARALSLLVSLCVGESERQPMVGSLLSLSDPCDVRGIRSNLYRSARAEAFAKMVLVQECVPEVHCLSVGDIPAGSRVAVSEESVGEPLGECLWVADIGHHLLDALQHCLKVVLLRTPSHQEIEALPLDVDLLQTTLDVEPVLARVEQDTKDQETCGRSPSPVSLLSLLVTALLAAVVVVTADHREHLAAPDGSKTVAEREREVRVNRLSLGHRGLGGEKEQHVMLLQCLPLLPGVLLHAAEVHRHLCDDAGGRSLSNARGCHMLDGKALRWRCHRPPAGEDSRTALPPPWRCPPQCLFEMLPNGECCLETEERKVPHEIVVEREELEAELGHCQTAVAVE